MIETVYIARSGPESPRNDTAGIAELPGGRLMVVWHRYKPGPDGASDFGLATVAGAFSADGGRSWSGHRLLVDVEPGDVNVHAPALCLLPGGELLLMCLRVHAKNSTSMVLYRSSDGGNGFRFATRIWGRSPGQWLQGGR